MAPKAERLAALARCCDDLRAAGVRAWAGGDSPEVRAVAAAHADGWNGWGVEANAFAGLADDVRRQADGREVEVTWAGQVLVGRTRREADEKLARHGNRPRLVHGTLDDLRVHFEGLAGAGATWAVCAPLDVGVDPGAVDLLAELADSIATDQ